MNADKVFIYKPNLTWLTKIALYLTVAFAALINSAQAAPCFSNAQSAYNYLLAQENLETQALTQRGVNINRASESELTSLKGIGSSKAQAIILYREMFGDFKNVNELAQVKGIGAKTIEKNRSRLQVQN